MNGGSFFSWYAVLMVVGREYKLRSMFMFISESKQGLHPCSRSAVVSRHDRCIAVPYHVPEREQGTIPHGTRTVLRHGLCFIFHCHAIPHRTMRYRIEYHGTVLLPRTVFRLVQGRRREFIPRPTSTPFFRFRP